MPKRAISVTLEEENLLWLRGRSLSSGFRSVSETLDRLVTEARSARDAGQIRSVVGTIDIAADDPDLRSADEFIRAQFAAALRKPSAARKKQSRGRR